MQRNKTAKQISETYHKQIYKSKTVQEAARIIQFRGMWEEIDSILNPPKINWKQLKEWGEYYYDDNDPLI